MKGIKKLSPPRVIALGFLLCILIGSLLLMLPISLNEGVSLSYIDALYTSTSAVCVTGLITVETADTFSVFGRTVIGILIQIGGLGVASIGAGVILMLGKKVNLRGGGIIKEALNLNGTNGIVKFIKEIFITTLIIEGAGALLSFLVFVKYYAPLEALGISVFHSVASFNNAGFDILGGFKSLTDYKDNYLLILTTSALIILGGIGFLVIKELLVKRFRWKKLSMHTRVVITVTFILLLSGTVLLKLTEGISWLGAFFNSVTARTAGFASHNIGAFSNAGLLLMMFLMFIGASSGSTGGGIKTGTLFVLFSGIRSSATNKNEEAFHYSVPKSAFRKAALVVILGIGIIVTGTFFLLVMEKDMSMKDALFEMVSAFGTVGLSTGVTPTLCTGSKILSMIIMFIGRLGPLTIATLWYASREEAVRYPEGNISIG